MNTYLLRKSSSDISKLCHNLSKIFEKRIFIKDSYYSRLTPKLPLERTLNLWSLSFGGIRCLAELCFGNECRNDGIWGRRRWRGWARRGGRRGRCQGRWADFMMRVPVLVLAEGATVTCQVAARTGLVSLPATVPAGLQERHHNHVEGLVRQPLDFLAIFLLLVESSKICLAQNTNISLIHYSYFVIFCSKRKLNNSSGIWPQKYMAKPVLKCLPN